MFSEVFVIIYNIIQLSFDVNYLNYLNIIKENSLNSLRPRLPNF